MIFKKLKDFLLTKVVKNSLKEMILDKLRAFFYSKIVKNYIK